MALLRSPRARWIGLVIGGAALVFLGWSLWQAGDEAWRHLVGHDLGGLAVLLAGFVMFQATALYSLRALGARPAGRIWAAAQLTKYLPVPGSAGFGLVGDAVRHGHSTRDAFGFLIRHSLLLVGAATVCSVPVVAPLGADLVGLDPMAVGVATAAAGLTLGYLSILSYPRRARAWALVIAVVGWASAFWVVGLGFEVEGPGPLVVGAIFAAGWVAGQIVVPVPAGIGVREAAMLWLGAPLVGTEAAIAFALLTRAMHVVVDGGLIAAVAARTRWSERSGSSSGA